MFTGYVTSNGEVDVEDSAISSSDTADRLMLSVPAREESEDQ